MSNYYSELAFEGFVRLLSFQACPGIHAVQNSVSMKYLSFAGKMLLLRNSVSVSQYVFVSF